MLCQTFYMDAEFKLYGSKKSYQLSEEAKHTIKHVRYGAHVFREAPSG